ncbi:YeiH family protein [Dethiothermospora halolimnae]|uniref:YeiH family protein n=1 Tax=Dethiothermospora halolimnae TaxID=3114390 RepID=UPI003CCBDECA
MKKLSPGLILVIILSLISMGINEFIFSHFKNLAIETLTIAIILGIIYSNTIGVKKSHESGITFSLKKILKWGIVLLGVKLNFDAVINLGPWIILIVVILITLALVLANVFGKIGKLNTKLSTLLGVGSSICGASAIVAMGPVIDADDEDTSIAVAVISMLGALGVFIYTFFAAVLPITDIQYGIWSGSSLQGVSHALAAAGAKGAKSLEIGTIVKMSRVALLAPVALILSIIFNKNNTKGSKKVKFPSYVLMFILVGVLFTLNSVYNIVPVEFTISNMNINIISMLKKISSFFILMAMVSMGLKVNFKSFTSKGVKALYVCSILFISISLISLGLTLMI